LKGHLRKYGGVVGVVGVAVGLALYQLLSFPVLDQLVVYSLLSEGLIMAISLVGLVGVQNTRKLKGIYPFLMAGFSLMFLSMLTDMLDEVVVHPMWITAVFEDLFQAVGYILVVAGLVRWAWHNEETKEQLYRLATTDYLTGAYNRRHFSKTLHDEVARAKRYGTSLSLISFDLDHFKNVNDRFGHDVGDRVLKDVAGLMERMSRASDTFARMGGEEFIILAPSTNIDEAKLFAEKLRHALENHQIDVVGRVTASFGVAQLGDGEGEEALLKRADDALYNSKYSGRNRWVAAA